MIIPGGGIKIFLVILINLNSRPFSSTTRFIRGWILIRPNDSNSWIYLCVSCSGNLIWSITNVWRISSFTLLCPNSAIKVSTSCNCFRIATKLGGSSYNIELTNSVIAFRPFFISQITSIHYINWLKLSITTYNDANHYADRVMAWHGCNSKLALDSYGDKDRIYF